MIYMGTKPGPSSAGLTAAIISVTVAFFVTFLIPPPWRFGTILLGIALSSYFSGYFVAAFS